MGRVAGSDSRRGGGHLWNSQRKCIGFIWELGVLPRRVDRGGGVGNSPDGHAHWHAQMWAPTGVRITMPAASRAL